MKKRRWIPLALMMLALTVVAVLALRQSWGTEEAKAQGGLAVSLDMETSNGPCTDIDNSVSHNQGDMYNIAVCVTGLPAALGVVTIHVLYDDTLNTATEVADAGKGLDDNPDANEGTTKWGNGLGTNFDCSGGTLAYPVGDKKPATGPGNGDAFIGCMDVLQGPWTLGDNETSGVLAVIEFEAKYEGTDTLTLSQIVLGDSAASEMGTCNPEVDYPMTCNGGQDNKSGQPVPTSTPTRTPLATATPCGPGGCPTSTPTPRAWTKTPTPAPTDTPAAPPPSEPSQQPPPPPPTGGGQPVVQPPSTGQGSDTGVWQPSALIGFGIAGTALLGAAIVFRRVKAR